MDFVRETVGRLPRRGIRDVRPQSFAEIDIFGNELFCLSSVTESGSNVSVLLYFVIFYSIDGRNSLIVRKGER